MSKRLCWQKGHTHQVSSCDGGVIDTVVEFSEIKASCLSAFSADSASKLNVLRHDGDTLSVNSAKVGVLEKRNEVGLGSFLESKDGGSLESEVVLEVLSNLTHKTLERKLADEEVSGLLVATDLTKSNGTRAVTVWLLHTSGSWS
mmetsp:Transcript_17427/g.28389  ORF Transcript_17427/g.28389 Transcript_17427/m.28389 type:complete len:145 (-) Transcript_17427:98-532(-)